MPLWSKKEQALEIALSIVANEESDVTEKEVKGWDEEDLSEWLEAWDYRWSGKQERWVHTDEMGEYQVGHLIHFEEDDPTFNTLQEATAHALEQQKDGSPYGIWRYKDGELLHVIYQGETFGK